MLVPVHTKQNKKARKDGNHAKRYTLEEECSGHARNIDITVHIACSEGGEGGKMRISSGFITTLRDLLARSGTGSALISPGSAKQK